jgi:hypothetical protein
MPLVRQDSTETNMTSKILIALALVAGMAGPALAFQCPADMAQIDAAMETAQLSEADKGKVMELRQQGEEYHTAGQHQQSVDALAQAKAILGI